MNNFSTIANAIYDGDQNTVVAQTKLAIEEGNTALEILEKGLMAGMDHVGKDFKAGDLFIPEVLVASRAMQAGMELLKPLLVSQKIKSPGKVILGTVKGDLHDIGKNLVSIMLQGAGFEVIDLGVDVSKETFLDAIVTHKPDLLGLSSLLTTTMPQMPEIIDAIQQAGLRDQVKIMVGGAPLNEKYAQTIGADGYAQNSSIAVEKAKELMSI
ncbi:MAG: cobalamin-binding protein [Pelolinea sp.]|jgi:5-methyltetrahydrofolate--homocysteine methyltransferase|nr:cobalamin-binding protein [Pelolinea sp.]